MGGAEQRANHRRSRGAGAALAGVGLAVALAAHGAGCATCTTPYDAPALPEDFEVDDEIGDGCAIDWRSLQSPDDALVQVSVRVGPLFERHDVVGTVGIYDPDGGVVQAVAVSPAQNRYELEAPVSARTRYYVRFEATDGEAPYSLVARYKPQDPCAACGPCDACVDGRCVPIPCCGKCPPEQCDIPTGQCRVDPCGGPCPLAMECNERSGRCEPMACDRSKDCPSGFTCKRGRCEERSGSSPPPPPQCRADADCGEGRACKRGKCVDAPTEAPVATRIQGSISQAWVDPQGRVQVRIVLPGGHGVVKGARGKLGSRTVRITEVTAFRAVGIVDGAGAVADLGGQKAVDLPVGQ